MAIYDVGDAPVVSANFLNSAGAPANPSTVVAKVRKPDGTILSYSTPTVTNPSLGTFSLVINLDVAGRWAYRFEGSGSLVAAEEGELYVAPSAFVAAPTTGRPAWVPKVSEVGALIPHRTADTATGEPIGTFDATTVPNAAQVDGLIVASQTEVAAIVGETPSPRVIDLARHAVALAAAAYVEAGFYPDMAVGTSGPASMLWDRYNAVIAELRALVTTGDDTIGTARPLWSFPSAVSAGSGTGDFERW